MKKIPLHKLQKRLQYFLNEISVCKPEEGQRVQMLKKKAKKTLYTLREQYPELQSMPLFGTFATPKTHG